MRILLIFLMLSSYCLAQEKAIFFLLQKVRYLMDQKRYDEAIDLLMRFKKKGYKSYLIDFYLGNCFFMKKDYISAKRSYLETIKKKKDFTSAWLNLGYCLYELKQYDSSANSFLKAYSFEKNPEYIYLASVSFLSAKNCSKAIDLLKRIPFEEKISWKEALSHAYIMCGRLKEALPLVEDLSEKKKEWKKTRIYIYMSLNMEERALVYLKRLIKEDPTDPYWWKMLSYVYLKKKRYKDALSSLIIKGFLEPLTDEEKKTAAKLCLILNIPKKAISFYKGIKKPEEEIMEQIAYCYIRIHREKEALKYIDKILKAYPKKKKFILLKAEILYKLKRYREAGIFFEKAAKVGIDPGKSWLMAGYSFLKAGEKRRAVFAFKKAKKYPSQKRYAENILKLLFQEHKSCKKAKDKKDTNQCL